MNTTANMGSARKRAAHPHRLCRTLLNVGEANKHIPEDAALADDVDLDAIRRLVSTLVRSSVLPSVQPRRDSSRALPTENTSGICCVGGLRRPVSTQLPGPATMCAIARAGSRRPQRTELRSALNRRRTSPPTLPASAELLPTSHSLTLHPRPVIPQSSRSQGDRIPLGAGSSDSHHLFFERSSSSRTVVNDMPRIACRFLPGPDRRACEEVDSSGHQWTRTREFSSDMSNWPSAGHVT
jgi:hypothetical protein